MSKSSTRPSVRAWAVQLLSGQPHEVIGAESAAGPLMLRWHVIPRNPLLQVYLHKFLRSDEDRALHDHPWNYASLVLKGAYVEIRQDDKALWRRPGSIAYRSATRRHRVVLFPEIDGGCRPCWTFFVTGRKIREWGFWCVDGAVGALGSAMGVRVAERFVHWRQWGSGGCGEDQ